MIAYKLNDQEVVEMTDRVIRWFENGKFKPKIRLGRIIGEVGLDDLKRAIGV